MSIFLASIQILKKTNADLTGVVLLDGQPAYDETNDVLVIGDGSTVFESLPKLSNELYFEVTIPSADVLTLGTTAVELVPAQGANKIIVPTKILAEMDYNTTPYATQGEVDIFSGGTKHCYSLPPDNGFLFGTVSRIVQGIVVSNTGATNTQYVANSPLEVFMQGGNPTAGDSDIIIRGWYKIVNV